MSDIRTLFQASAFLKIPTMRLKAAVASGRLKNHGGDLAGQMRISVAEAQQWFDAEQQATQAVKPKTETRKRSTKGKP